MIFIDPPYWPAHGTVFSHLISDTSVAELHTFAAANGVSERAFDLDHYDVPERLYNALVEAGATPLSGKELARTLAASGLRIKAKYRVKSVASVLERRWQALMPGQANLGVELLGRWNEPHRSYHSATHLLAVLEALELLTERRVLRTVALAAWFHDAVYNGSATDEEDSAILAQACLEGVLPDTDVAEVARLVRLTATHSPAPGDDAGARNGLKRRRTPVRCRPVHFGRSLRALQPLRCGRSQGLYPRPGRRIHKGEGRRRAPTANP